MDLRTFAYDMKYMIDFTQDTLYFLGLYCFHLPIPLYGFMLQKDTYIDMYKYNTGWYATIKIPKLDLDIFEVQVNWLF